MRPIHTPLPLPNPNKPSPPSAITYPAFPPRSSFNLPARAMRIRRSASKLLGLATARPASPPRWASSEPEASACAAAGAFDVETAAGTICQLNCSPWDAMPNLQLAMFFQDEDEEGRGVPAHGFEVKEEEYEELAETSLLPAHSESNLTHEEGTAEGEKMIREKKTKTKKKVNKGKGKDQVENGGQAVDVEGPMTCKKTDGKGWRCKRPVHHPHSLCQYHLAQVRNYGVGQSNGAASTELASDCKSSTAARSRKKSSTSAAADANFYYYYSGFGPWRGKTRGGSSSSKTSECTNANEDCDDLVAGEDECTVDDDEEDRGGEGCEDAEEKTRRKVKKRGRKPVKARSLMSLL